MEIAEMKVREEIANQQLFRVPSPHLLMSGLVGSGAVHTVLPGRPFGGQTPPAPYIYVMMTYLNIKSWPAMRFVAYSPHRLWASSERWRSRR